MRPFGSKALGLDPFFSVILSPSPEWVEWAAKNLMTKSETCNWGSYFEKQDMVAGLDMRHGKAGVILKKVGRINERKLRKWGDGGPILGKEWEFI